MRLALIGYGTMGKLIGALANDAGHSVVVTVNESHAGLGAANLAESLKIADVICGRGEIEVLSCSEPVKLHPVAGLTQKVVRSTTDIPHMPNWGKPLLLGPGSILVAHTKDEFVSKRDLEEAVGLYINLTKRLLATKE